jgi:hypothetical protein
MKWKPGRHVGDNGCSGVSQSFVYLFCILHVYVNLWKRSLCVQTWLGHVDHGEIPTHLSCCKPCVFSWSPPPPRVIDRHPIFARSYETWCHLPLARCAASILLGYKTANLSRQTLLITTPCHGFLCIWVLLPNMTSRCDREDVPIGRPFYFHITKMALFWKEIIWCRNFAVKTELLPSITTKSATIPEFKFCEN